MKRLLLLGGLLGAMMPVSASPVFQPMGSNLTFGSSSNMQSLLGYVNNPAAPAMSLQAQKWNFGMGILSSIGTSVEVGPVDNYADEIEALGDELEAFNNSTTKSQSQANAIRDRFNSFLQDAGENGYMNLGIAAEVPLFPLVYSSRAFLGGSLVFDANVSAVVKMSVLDSPIEYNQLAPDEAKLETNTALYLKTAQVGELSLGYSRQLWTGDAGSLSAGLRASYYLLGLRKTVVGVAVADNVTQLMEDERDKSTDYQSGYGVDLGLLWQARNYRIGTTLRNVNSPSFDYDPIGVDCGALSGASQDSCLIAQSYANEIDLRETYVMDPQGNVELAYFSDSRNWVISATVDTNPVNDPLANQYQWAVIGAGYATSSWWIPGFRVGYRKNLAGSQLSYATLGLTLFKMLNIDAAYGLETIEIDQSQAPRSVMINAGLEVLF